MENFTDSFKHMKLKKALFTESEDTDEEDTLNISSWKTALSIRRSLSCGNILNEEFYPPEVGREMIFRDQKAEAGNTSQNATSCSAWVINSRHYSPEGFARTVKRQCRELFVDLNDCTGLSGFSASTPKLNQPFMFPTTPALPKTKDTILESSVKDHCDAGFDRRDSCLIPMLLFGTTTANKLNVSRIVGKAKKPNTRTLEAEKIPDDPSRAPSSSKGIPTSQSLDYPGCAENTSKISVKDNIRSLNIEDELWIVQPHVLQLDANGRGRLSLINKSSYRNLKFQIEFDCKLINVCPQSGNLKSKSQLGLRVIVSRYVKENSNEVMEDIIRITCGNIEKTVPVRMCKVQKIKSVKDRSFRCF